MKKFKNTPTKTDIAKSTPTKAEIIKPQFAKSEPIKAQQLRILTGSAPVQAVKSEVPKVGRVSFELVKPDAKQVSVAGSFNDWKPEVAPLFPKDNGRWVGDLPIKPGRYEYLFVVDGEWIPDPNAKESVQNPFGGRNSILGVSE